MIIPWHNPGNAEPLAVTSQPGVSILPEAIPIRAKGSRVRRIPNTINLPQPGFSDLPEAGREFASPTISDYKRWRDAFRKEALSLLGSTDLLAQLHAEHFRKWVPENGTTSGWYGRLEKWRPDAKPISDITISNIRNHLLYGSREEAAPYSTRVKMGTNPGWPIWYKNDKAYIASMALAHSIIVGQTTLDDAEGRLRNLFELSFGTCATLLHRTGPIAKAQDIFAFAQGELAKVGSWLGYAPRRRDVNMVPRYINEVARDDWQRVTTLLKRHYSFSATSSSETALIVGEISDNIRRTTGHEPWIGSDDASAFDDSISGTHIKQMSSALPAWARHAKLVDDYTLELPLLVGPHFEGDEAFLLARNGTMLSGEIKTSPGDSIINFAVLLDVLGEMMFDGPADAYLKWQYRQWGCFIQGDDTFLILPRELEPDRYLALCKEYGYTRKISQFPVFLMTWYDAQGRYHGLSSRAACRTVTREHQAPGRFTELFGALARWERCRFDPYFSRHWDLIKDNPLFAEFKISSFKKLKEFVTTPHFIKEAEDEIKKTPQGLTRWADLVYWASGALGPNALGETAAQAFRYLGGYQTILPLFKDQRDLERESETLDWFQVYREIKKELEPK